jgi:hypothetical protein
MIKNNLKLKVMKTKLLLIATMLIASITMGYAKDPNPTEVNLKKIINKEISYPKAAIEQNIEGEVTVEFKVTADGKIEVINCYTNQGVLYTHVMKSLENITITPDEQLTGKTFTIQFDFELI